MRRCGQLASVMFTSEWVGSQHAMLAGCGRLGADSGRVSKCHAALVPPSVVACGVRRGQLCSRSTASRSAGGANGGDWGDPAAHRQSEAVALAATCCGVGDGDGDGEGEGDWDWNGVSVRVPVAVPDPVPVAVGVPVPVAVGVPVAVAVSIPVPVAVGVAVPVGVLVADVAVLVANWDGGADADVVGEGGTLA
jgi:hypothetical protein